jgi:hypothetical protein
LVQAVDNRANYYQVPSLLAVSALSDGSIVVVSNGR